MSQNAPETPRREAGRDEVLRSATGLLALQSLPKIGPKNALRIALVTAQFDDVMREFGTSWEAAVRNAERELERWRLDGVHALSIFDVAYPDRLRAIPDPPPVLFFRGSLDALRNGRVVAVVGTREPTEFGCSAAQEVVAGLAGRDWAVVSGLAKGIDTMAHGAALKHHTETVAVLAGGLDRIYPAENRELAEAITDTGGALVGERRAGTRPRASDFVARNRIQSGLAAAVFVAQTGIKGGTMHTVRHAAAQGRPIFAAVPHTRHPKNEGLHALLETPAQDLWQRLPAWSQARRLCLRLGDAPLAQPVTKDDVEVFLDALELIVENDPQINPEPRWWPELDPPSRHTEQDVVAEDDAQAPLFAVAD